MNKVFLLISSVMLLTAFVVGQEADSLLLANFDNDNLNGCVKFGDSGDEVMVSADPEGGDNKVLECIIDCGISDTDENKGGFSKSGVQIVVEGDTATALVAYVWLDEEAQAELLGFQIFSMDQSAWQWKDTWYTPAQITPETWTRLMFPFSISFEEVAGFDTLLNAGLMCGVEFDFNAGTDWFGSVYADDIYLLGVKGNPALGTEPAPIVPVPGTFELEQNYPNPFNPTTNIVYTLPQRDRVTITIYDVTGRLITKLIDHEPQPAGRVAVPFNAGDLSSGVYYYKVQTSTTAQTKKMVLVR